MNNLERRRSSLGSIANGGEHGCLVEVGGPSLPLLQPTSGRRRGSSSSSECGPHAPEMSHSVVIPPSLVKSESSSQSLPFSKRDVLKPTPQIMMATCVGVLTLLIILVSLWGSSSSSSGTSKSDSRLGKVSLGEGVKIRDGSVAELQPGFGNLEIFAQENHLKMHDEYDEDEFDDPADKSLQLGAVCYRARTFKACSQLVNLGEKCHWSNWRHRCRVDINSVPESELVIPEKQRHHPQASLLAPPINLELCLNDPDQCPRLPLGTLAKEYPQRFFPEAAQSCDAICFELFGTSTKPWSKHVANACEIGCGYREQLLALEARSTQSKYHQLARKPAGECAMACKDTVFGFESDEESCNLKNGLGIVVPLRDMNAVMACEIGCLIGGERLCPQCEST